MPLSAVIITYNEEKNITRCLNSLSEVADEIVVVDSFSTDRTLEIAQTFGAKIVQRPFDSYIQQKNFASEQAQFDFILSLDADEALDEKLKKSILSLKEKPLADAYWLNRLTNYCGHWVRFCWYPDYNLRLFDRRCGQWTGNTPHEWFEPRLKSDHLPRLDGHILHYSYYSIHDHFVKVNHYTDLAALSLFEKSKKAKIHHLIINPLWTFIKMYFLKLGILDGYKGLQICGISAYASYLKYKKLKKLYSGSGKLK
ncbi:MAG: glycosyltransferase family 2 protein [Saprospiraceae bacterium]|nr:glycosyltransferase family 2 protein [Saprospiraceae bacterium]